jgi:predicted ribosome quality control (RQC) complex YloA/Tae2 family protein
LHNNYYFLKKLVNQLQNTLHQAVVSECFSQDKDELIIRFETKDNPFYIKAILHSDFCCLAFPPDFSRARKNSVNLFNMLIGQRVISVTQFENERSFAIHFQQNISLLFKMHGNRSNIVVFENGCATTLFRNHLRQDLTITLQDLNKSIDWSFEALKENESDLRKLYYTFGKPVWNYLSSTGFNELSTEDKFKAIQLLRAEFEKEEYYIVETSGSIHLSLIPINQVREKYTSPSKAITAFCFLYLQSQAFLNLKNQTLAELHAHLKSSTNFIKKNTAKLKQLEEDSQYKTWADLIMSNLHAIPMGVDKITLTDFYNDKPVEIKLKSNLNPQKNAEVFYRKAKNQQIEITKLKEAVQQKELTVLHLQTKIKKIEDANSLKELKSLHQSESGTPQKKETRTQPYHEFEYNNYKIWVGKNAAQNDVLTLKHTFKDDLWLHAKDVAGSHVVIKHQAGKPFPKDVIERAAQLAAYNSKRKNETLCPVAYTQKKYVRKRKGDPPGAVIVEREEVILVEPKL